MWRIYQSTLPDLAGSAQHPYRRSHLVKQPERDDDAPVVAALDDPAAFNELFTRYMSRVYRFCRSRTGNGKSRPTSLNSTSSEHPSVFLCWDPITWEAKGFAP